MKFNFDDIFDYITNQNLNLRSSRPTTKFRPSTQFQFLKDQNNEIVEPRQLDTKLYNQEFKKFGNSRFYSFNRAALVNRTLYGEIARKSNKDLCSLDSDLFLMHWMGHLDSPLVASRSQRNIEYYYMFLYSQKADAINDVLLFLTSNPSEEVLEHVRSFLKNRIDYLLVSRSEYSIDAIQVRIDRINHLLKFGKQKKTKSLIDFLSYLIQESMLLCVSLRFVIQLLGADQIEMTKVGQYAHKLNELIQSNQLNLFIIESITDQTLYFLIKAKESIITPTKTSDLHIPINLLMYGLSLPASINLTNDPGNYPSSLIEEMYSFNNVPVDACPKLKNILQGSQSQDTTVKLITALVKEEFLHLVKNSSC